jgi:DNA-directed RNA polymerase specialized sigma24 family protein
VRRAAQGPLAAGCVLDAQTLSDEQAVTAEQELLAAERHAALREALADLPPDRQRLINLLIALMSCTQISTRLVIPVSSIGPTRHRCLDKLRHDLFSHHRTDRHRSPQTSITSPPMCCVRCGTGISRGSS